MNRSIYLTDLVRSIGGYPIDIMAIASLLEKADNVLPNGRDHKEALTDEQIESLGFELPMSN